MNEYEESPKKGKNEFPLIPRNYNLFVFIDWSIKIGTALTGASFLVWYILKFHFGMGSDNFILSTITTILSDYPQIFYISLGVGLMLLGYAVPIKSVFFKKPKFDPWLWDIVSNRTSTNIAAYDSEKLYLAFDRNLRPSDIKDTITEINDKSTDYTYYMGYIDINNAQYSIIPVEKEDIPTRAILDPDTDTAWNIVPLGKAVNNRTKQISDYSWKMANGEKRDDVFETIMSMSLLVSGGTGSGKSVLQQAIVGHLSRHEDRFQSIGVDVKMVEFIRFEKVKSFKRIALTVSDAQQCIKAAQDFMYKRYEMMKTHRVNNIADLEGEEVDYYEFMGKKYQFDELMPVRKDGKFAMLMIEEVVKALEEGSQVELLKVVD